MSWQSFSGKKRLCISYVEEKIMVNKVRIEIAGSRYVIATPEGEERVLSLGREIDAQVRQLMDGNDRVSLNDALVLCCLNYANAYKKSEESADNMRTQLTDYLEDATLARIELDETKRENERLKRRLEMLGGSEDGQTKL